MKKIYTESDLSTMDSVIKKTTEYITTNIEQFDIVGLQRSSRMSEVLKLPLSKQRKILDCITKIDRNIVFEDFKVDIITSLMNVMILNQQNIDRLTKDQLINFSLYLTESPVEDYQRQSALMGNRTVLDPLFFLTQDYFKQRSILRYIEATSQNVVNWQDENEQIRFQDATKEMLMSEDIDTLLEKTDYKQNLEEVFETAKQVL